MSGTPIGDHTAIVVRGNDPHRVSDAFLPAIERSPLAGGHTTIDRENRTGAGARGDAALALIGCDRTFAGHGICQLLGLNAVKIG